MRRIIREDEPLRPSRSSARSVTEATADLPASPHRPASSFAATLRRARLDRDEVPWKKTAPAATSPPPALPPTSSVIFPTNLSSPAPRPHVPLPKIRPQTQTRPRHRRRHRRLPILARASAPGRPCEPRQPRPRPTPTSKRQMPTPLDQVIAQVATLQRDEAKSLRAPAWSDTLYAAHMNLAHMPLGTMRPFPTCRLAGSIVPSQGSRPPRVRVALSPARAPAGSAADVEGWR